jgi:enoyl-CoA hydratase
VEYPELRTLRTERDGDVLITRIDNPASRLNSVDDVLHDDLDTFFRLATEEREARAIVLTGRSDAFSAGGDFNWFPTLQEPGKLEDLLRSARRIVWNLLDIDIPVIAAVSGHAVGLGASLALLSDIVFMARSAKLRDPHVAVGLGAGDGGVLAWTLAAGPARAKQYLLTGDSLSADEAERIGLVNFVVDDERVLDEALAFAHRVAQLPPLAVSLTKRAVNKFLKDGANTAFDYSTAVEMMTFRSQDHAEAVAALTEHRAPVFHGR